LGRGTGEEDDGGKKRSRGSWGLGDFGPDRVHTGTRRGRGPRAWLLPWLGWRISWGLE
jgi:hypothetical protein